MTGGDGQAVKKGFRYYENNEQTVGKNHFRSSRNEVCNSTKKNQHGGTERWSIDDRVTGHRQSLDPPEIRSGFSQPECIRSRSSRDEFESNENAREMKTHRIGAKSLTSGPVTP